MWIPRNGNPGFSKSRTRDPGGFAVPRSSDLYGLTEIPTPEMNLSGFLSTGTGPDRTVAVIGSISVGHPYLRAVISASYGLKKS
jgi:hypothetical protein